MTRNAPTIRNAATPNANTSADPAPAAPNSFIAITDNIAIKEVNGTTVVRIGRTGPLDKYAVRVEEVNNDLGQLRITRSEEFKFEGEGEGEGEKGEGGLFIKFCDFLQREIDKLKGMWEDVMSEAIKEIGEDKKNEQKKKVEGTKVDGTDSKVKDDETDASLLKKLHDYFTSSEPFTWTEFGLLVLADILLGLVIIGIIVTTHD